MNELRYAVRALMARPLFSAVSALLLAIGIGATTSVYSVVHGVLLTPLPFAEPDRLVRIWNNDVERGFSHFPVTYPELQRWRETNTHFDAMAAMWNSGPFDAVMTRDGVAERVNMLVVTTNFFDTLGVSAMHGRTLLDDDRAGGDAPAMVVSHRLWESAFSSDPGVVGKSVRLLYGPFDRYRIVGVLPPGVDYPSDAEVYVPVLAIYPDWETSRRFEAVR